MISKVIKKYLYSWQAAINFTATIVTFLSQNRIIRPTTTIWNSKVDYYRLITILPRKIQCVINPGTSDDYLKLTIIDLISCLRMNEVSKYNATKIINEFVQIKLGIVIPNLFQPLLAHRSYADMITNMSKTKKRR